MYIAGEMNKGHLLSVYAIFEKLENIRNYLNTNTAIKDSDLAVLKYELSFPFLILETFEEGRNIYTPITKEKFKQRLEILLPEMEIHFNLWSIQQGGYNQWYPSEAMLTGRNKHVHFDQVALAELEAEGFDVYWDGLI